MTRWQVTKAVRASRTLPAPSRLIMLTLADVAVVGTAEIPAKFTPSLRVLADETGLNESTVTRHLNALDKLGWIERTRPTIEDARTKGERTRYKLTLPPGVVAEDTDEGAHDTHVDAESTEPSCTVHGDQGAECMEAGCTVHPIKEEVRSSSDHQINPSSSSPPAPKERKRGTRIPEGFAITDPMRSWAYTEAAEVLGRDPDRPKLDAQLDRWTAEFIDYWTGKSGAGATKVDWPATWRNRVRVKIEQAAQQAPGNAVALRNGHKPSTTDQRVAAAQALKGRFGGSA